MTGESAALVDAIAAGREIPGQTVQILVPLPPGPGGERPISVDQTNISVVVGERVVVKCMREPGYGRAPALLAHLAEAGFTRMPTPHAAVFSDADGTLTALVTGYLPGAEDGWDWCVDVLLASLDGGPPADFGAELGRIAADLHAALATPTSVDPRPVSSGVFPVGETVLDEALAAAGDDADGRWVRSLRARLAADLDGPARSRPSPTSLVHGDLHVGQVLRWDGGFAVTDFDGNPVADDRPEPLARDIAQLRTSLLNVAEIANRRTEWRLVERLRAWGREAADELLTAYREGLTAHGLDHLLDLDLVRPFEVEQECRELIYAARFLPRWRYAPVGVLKSWYPEDAP
jgi:maltokinase